MYNGHPYVGLDQVVATCWSCGTLQCTCCFSLGQGRLVAKTGSSNTNAHVHTVCAVYTVHALIFARQIFWAIWKGDLFLFSQVVFHLKK